MARARPIIGIDYVIHNLKKIFKDYTIVDESISYSPTLRSIMGYGHNRYFTAKNGQLGWGLTASMGISIVNEKTMAVLGDGSFMYSVQGLWTAKRYGIPIKVVVLGNGGL